MFVKLLDRLLDVGSGGKNYRFLLIRFSQCGNVKGSRERHTIFTKKSKSRRFAGKGTHSGISSFFVGGTFSLSSFPSMTWDEMDMTHSGSVRRIS